MREQQGTAGVQPQPGGGQRLGEPVVSAFRIARRRSGAGTRPQGRRLATTCDASVSFHICILTTANGAAVCGDQREP